MNTTITWKVSGMESYRKFYIYDNVIFKAFWTCSGVQTYNGTVYESKIYGSTNLLLDLNSPFISYDDLTENDVLGWIWYTIGDDLKNGYETSVDQMIYCQINPPQLVLYTPCIVSGSVQNVYVDIVAAVKCEPLPWLINQN
jgi:hypothetical protein